jgi:hypothetical protein
MLSEEQTHDLAAKASTWFHQHPVALAFVHVNSGDRKRIPAWGRTLDEDGLHAGQLLPVPLG